MFLCPAPGYDRHHLGTRFGPSAVGAWPVLTDAILTELSGQNQPVNRPVSR
jgi:hypothetical protein